MSDLISIIQDTAPDYADRLLELRARILKVASDIGVAPIEETLKWGEPALVPPKQIGTTIRLGARAEQCALFVHCQTSLVEQWRSLFPDAFTYEGNRGVLIPAAGAFDHAAFDQMVAMALTYHQNKRGRA
ncbi:DUF1801 domain-containing protein [Shimia ponticola]|uniref:DUF1801 domain-containing protein n=1 Tax=Shimia ponticola TaxID=2582893 RepID=UPI0011BF693B|nr:DUF1801 domain-containing protein [Shimia ponticola]